MSLKESQALTGVHPYLADRIRWMGQVIDIWGGRQIYHSGVRSLERQQELYDTVRTNPVAAPGCSQHNYGFAVDVSWLPIMSFADNRQLSGPATNNLMKDLGRHIGLVTVPNDLNHFQIYPGTQFREWAVASRFCDPNHPPPVWRTPVQSFLEANCPPGSGGVVCDNLGCHCQLTLDQLRGIESTIA